MNTSRNRLSAESLPYAILGGWVIGGALAVIVWTAIDQAAHPPSCSGIGWGCSPDPFTTVVIFGCFVMPYLMAVGAAVVGLGWLARSSALANDLQTAIAVAGPPLAAALALS